MRFLRGLNGFTGAQAWDAQPIGDVDGVTVKVHWTDQPYRWHINDGAKVFLMTERKGSA